MLSVYYTEVAQGKACQEVKDCADDGGARKSQYSAETIMAYLCLISATPLMYKQFSMFAACAIFA